jgi:hypothetical protein
MSTPLDVSTYQRPDGTWVMTVAGEVDISNAGAFQRAWLTSSPCAGSWGNRAAGRRGPDEDRRPGMRPRLSRLRRAQGPKRPGEFMRLQFHVAPFPARAGGLYRIPGKGHAGSAADDARRHRGPKVKNA